MSPGESSQGHGGDGADELQNSPCTVQGGFGSLALCPLP